MEKTIDLQVEELKRLPVNHEDVWHGTIVRLPAWVGSGDEPRYRPRLAVWLSERSGLAGHGDLLKPDDPVGESGLSGLLDLARLADMGYRPSQVKILGSELISVVAEDLGVVGIEFEAIDESPLIDNFKRVLAEKATGPDAFMASIEVPGTTVENLRTFAEAAREFYLAAPWNHLSSRDVVQVESGTPDKELTYFTVLGAEAEIYGIGFFSSKERHETMISARDPQAYFESGSHWSLMYGPISDLTIPDSELWEREGLPVAGDDAYPRLFLFDGRQLQLADARVLGFVEALLRALSRTTEEELDSGRWSKKVAAGAGEVEVALSIPALLEPRKRRGPAEMISAGGIPDRRLGEQVIVDIQKLLAEHDFNSVDEINEFMSKQSFGKPIPHKKATTSQEKGQDFFYDALEESGRLRIKLAREAIRLWPDCADAWVLLAEEMPGRERAMELYRQGVEAGKRAIGPGPFRDDVGRFWGLVETRPYMRAVEGLASCLEVMGQRADAIDHWKDLLRLNPGDNQGVRFRLLPKLMLAGRSDEARSVLASYPDDVAALMVYMRPLLEYQASGDTAEARELLQLATRANPHVPKYLLDKASLPERPPESYRLGGEDEAIAYAPGLLPAWRLVPGSIEWLAQIQRQRKKDRKKKKAATTKTRKRRR